MQRLAIFVIVVAAVLQTTLACQKFSAGAWANLRKEAWKTPGMSGMCVAEWQAHGGNQVTFGGFFISPPGATSVQIEELQSIVIYRRHCLNFCYSLINRPVIGKISINKGASFVDSVNPDTIWVQCVCPSGASSPQQNMVTLHDEFMANCHLTGTGFTTTTTLSPTTTVTTVVPTTTLPAVQGDPNLANGENAVEVGCFSDIVGNHTLTGGEIKYFTILNKYSCARHCYGQGYMYFGLSFFTQCHCGSEIDIPVATTRIVLEGHCTESDYDDPNGNGFDATPCNWDGGDPSTGRTTPYRDYERGPWCGGHGHVYIYQIVPATSI